MSEGQHTPGEDALIDLYNETAAERDSLRAQRDKQAAGNIAAAALLREQVDENDRLRAQVEELRGALERMVRDATRYSTGGCGDEACGPDHDCGNPVQFRDFESTQRARAALAYTKEPGA